MALFIPELLLQKHIQEFITLIKESINESLVDNLLTRMFAGVPVVGDLDYQSEALALFRKETPPFGIKVGYNIGVAKDLPLILISLPSEEVTTQPVGLLSGEYVDVDTTEEGSTIRVPEKEEFYKPNYRISIATLNADMTVIIYNVLKWMFLHRRSQIELDGMLNFKVHSQDVQQEGGMVPQTLYIRSLVLEFVYSLTAAPSEYDAGVGKAALYDKTPNFITPVTNTQG
jgi:hypothetical protein